MTVPLGNSQGTYNVDKKADMRRLRFENSKHLLDLQNFYKAKLMKICLIHTLRFGVDLEESGKPFHNWPGLSACTW